MDVISIESLRALPKMPMYKNSNAPTAPGNGTELEPVIQNACFAITLKKEPPVDALKQTKQVIKICVIRWDRFSKSTLRNNHLLSEIIEIQRAYWSMVCRSF